jgi:flagellar motility protein MotE (MotC chaperone)
MKKLQIIILASAGLVSFVSVFTVSWFIKRSQPVLPQATQEQVREGTSPEMFDISGPGSNTEISLLEDDSTSYRLSKSMTEKQLKSLIYDIREKMKEYRYSEKELDRRRQRMQVIQDTLQKDIDRLDTLRVQLTSILSNLQQQEHSLKQTILKIKKTEQTNMKNLAARYDKMSTDLATNIMINMASNNQLNDAVKIMYYMSERTSGKLLGEIGNSKPNLAALISLQLKRIKESE